MSLWAEYVKEKYSKESIEEENGFAIYYMIPSNSELYVEDIYVRPEFRRKGEFISLIKKLVKVAIDNEAEKVSCFVYLLSNHPEESMLWILKLGFKVSHATQDNRLFFVLQTKDFKYE